MSKKVTESFQIAIPAGRNHEIFHNKERLRFLIRVPTGYNLVKSKRLRGKGKKELYSNLLDSGIPNQGKCLYFQSSTLGSIQKNSGVQNKSSY